jgi:hypothetical protein
MKSYFYAFIIFLLACVISSTASAQGCVAVRAMGGLNPLSTNGYTLPKGEFQLGTNYRYFHSFRHFVGTDEKKFRQNTQGGFDANGNEKGNAVNIYSHAIDLNISYALTDRLQVNVSIPYVHNERSQVLKVATGDKVMIDGKLTDQVTQGIRYSVYAQGLGDIRVSSNYWIFDPASASKGNLSIGLGIKTNSGSHNRKDQAITLDSKTKQVVTETQTMDQAIQPGDGGVGFSIELQGFRQLYKGIYGFASGYYLFNPRESNGTFKSAPTKVMTQDGKTELGTLYGYNVYASPDQYFARAGVMGSVAHNLVVSVAGRFEGIPAYDVFGGQQAYRRPGYVVAVEGGVSYRAGKHSFGLFVPVNFVRNRIQSAADIASQKLQNSVITTESEKVHVQGDAAFADYSININYSYRLGKLFAKKAQSAFQTEAVTK